MSANLYDLLNVDETASVDEIRAAWKTAIADLDPTERRFRAYSDAAGVLLDPDKRAAYDAELATARAVEAAEQEERAQQEAQDEPDRVDLVKGGAGAATSPSPSDDSDSGDASRPVTATDTGTGTDTEAGAATPRSGRFAAGPSRGALIAAGVVAVLALTLVAWLVSLDGVRADTSPKDAAERATRLERATLAVESAAEQMVAPVLSYNYETMAADLERRREYLTPALAEKQAKGWPEITKEAVSQQAVVEAAPTATALTRIDPDGKRATVVVYLDQRVAKKGTEPFVLRMWATLSLVKSSGSEDTWLLDDLCTDASCQ